eukprot:2829116-Pleurochrysis_carterae.AAC.2
MLSLSRRTAFAILSDRTVSSSWAEAGRERFNCCKECTKEFKAVTVGYAMPRTSCEWSNAAMVALVAEHAALASAARVRSSSSLPLPLLERA